MLKRIFACWNILSRRKIWNGMNNGRAAFWNISCSADFCCLRFFDNADLRSYNFNSHGECYFSCYRRKRKLEGKDVRVFN